MKKKILSYHQENFAGKLKSITVGKQQKSNTQAKLQYPVVQLTEKLLGSLFVIRTKEVKLLSIKLIQIKMASLIN